MNHALILSVVTFIYFISFILYLLRIILKGEWPGRMASLLTSLGFAAQTLALALRWRESYLLKIGHMPLTNFYESLIFFSWMIILIYLIIEGCIGSRASGVFTVPLAFLAMAYASFSPDINNRIEPLIPALQSSWLTSHVFSCFTGYAAFAVSFGFALLYLLKNKVGKNPALQV
jgi:ABC-type transport system involved in cytochrome c biogenesis permease subunit